MPNKQEEIREWIEMLLRIAPVPLDDVENVTNTLLEYLDAKGVVIKVGKDGSEPFYVRLNMDRVALSGKTAYIETPALEKAGYVAVEPLIKEGK